MPDFVVLLWRRGSVRLSLEIPLYEVIVVNHGSGKSTIVRKVACETCGAVYAPIEPTVDLKSGVAEAILDAIGGPRPTSWPGQIWKKMVIGKCCKSVTSSGI